MIFEDKKRVQLRDLKDLSVLPSFIEQCESKYRVRVENIAHKVLEAGVPVVLVAGPSASGKTTSSRRLARTMTQMGKNTQVISLDNFFKNIEDYPKQKNGEPDFEHLHSLDVETVNECIYELATTGSTFIPSFDFASHTSTPRAQEIRIDRDSAVIIEGIHALNPELTRKVDHSYVIKVYAGLRSEYYSGRKRIIATRDLRITRRIIRDERERGSDPEETLSLWKNIMAGEEKWIKPFKVDADYLLNTGFDYEPCLYAEDIRHLAEAGAGGQYQPQLETLAACFDEVESIPMDAVPKDSMLREFIGGLDLGE